MALTCKQLFDIRPHADRYLEATDKLTNGLGEIRERKEISRLETMRERNLLAIARITRIATRGTTKLTQKQWSQSVEIAKGVKDRIALIQSKFKEINP